MEKQHRIHWKKGLDITPEILIDSDNYHIAERNLLGRFFASRLYGILPESKFSIEHDFYNDRLLIKSIECLAITQSGKVINIQNKTALKRELQLKESYDGDVYVVLSVISATTTNFLENDLHIFSEYDLSIARTNEPIHNGIPILKILKNQSGWEVGKNYIPPSIACNSVNHLKRRFDDMLHLIHKIADKITENNPLFLQVKMLELELDKNSSILTPKEFTIIAKKFCLLFNTFLKTTKKPDALKWMSKFIDMEYNHNEIETIMFLGNESLLETLTILEAEPIPEPKKEVPIYDEIKV